jgi:hypothetical protein
MKTIKQFILEVLTAGAFSPTAFVVRAVLIAVAFYISELLGLREYTTFLSGTSANPNLSADTGAMLGVIHLVLYVAFILIAPSCLLCAFFLKAAWFTKELRHRKRNSVA